MAEPTEFAGEIAYVIKGFPRLSETFIANEIYLLEQLGLRLRLYSVKPGETEKVHSVISRIRAPLVTLPEMTSVSGCSLPGWLLRHQRLFRTAHARLFRRRPAAYLKTLVRALVMGWRYRPAGSSLRKSVIKEFVQAGMIANDVLEHDSVNHLHGHFCHGATTITWFVGELAGRSFSFTAHAKDIYQLKLNPGDLLQRKLRAARFVATCTGANVKHLRRLYGVDAAKVYKIYHGLDTRVFVPLKRNADGVMQGLPVLLAVGRFVEKKGFIDLIDACGQLAAAGVMFQCLIIGEHGAQIDPVRERIASRGLADQVTLQNAVTQDELRRVYARATAFVLPCRVVDDGDRDGIPNVLVEAMAMGLPVVSTPVSGIPELVEDGVSGLLVPARDPHALADAISRLLAEPALRTQLGRAARSTVCRDFDSGETTKTLRTLLAAAARGAPVPAERSTADGALV